MQNMKAHFRQSVSYNSKLTIVRKQFSTILKNKSAFFTFYFMHNQHSMQTGENNALKPFINTCIYNITLYYIDLH